jgi:hypothetical protein
VYTEISLVRLLGSFTQCELMMTLFVFANIAVSTVPARVIYGIGLLLFTTGSLVVLRPPVRMQIPLFMIYGMLTRYPLVVVLYGRSSYIYFVEGDPKEFIPATAMLCHCSYEVLNMVHTCYSPLGLVCGQFLTATLCGVHLHVQTVNK